MRDKMGGNFNIFKEEKEDGDLRFEYNEYDDKIYVWRFSKKVCEISIDDFEKLVKWVKEVEEEDLEE